METAIQIVFLVIMSVGILGLPLYFVLNSRRKRLLEEYEENQAKESE